MKKLFYLLACLFFWHVLSQTSAYSSQPSNPWQEPPAERLYKIVESYVDFLSDTKEKDTQVLEKGNLPESEKDMLRGWIAHLDEVIEWKSEDLLGKSEKYRRGDPEYTAEIMFEHLLKARMDKLIERTQAVRRILDAKRLGSECAVVVPTAATGPYVSWFKRLYSQELVDTFYEQTRILTIDDYQFFVRMIQTLAPAVNLDKLSKQAKMTLRASISLHPLLLGATDDLGLPDEAGGYGVFDYNSFAAGVPVYETVDATCYYALENPGHPVAAQINLPDEEWMYPDKVKAKHKMQREAREAEQKKQWRADQARRKKQERKRQARLKKTEAARNASFLEDTIPVKKKKKKKKKGKRNNANRVVMNRPANKKPDKVESKPVVEVAKQQPVDSSNLAPPLAQDVAKMALKSSSKGKEEEADQEGPQEATEDFFPSLALASPSSTKQVFHAPIKDVTKDPQQAGIRVVVEDPKDENLIDWWEKRLSSKQLGTLKDIFDKKPGIKHDSFVRLLKSLGCIIKPGKGSHQSVYYSLVKAGRKIKLGGGVYRPHGGDPAHGKRTVKSLLSVLESYRAVKVAESQVMLDEAI